MSVKIIAEAGVNHNGSLELAQKLIRVAKRAEADYVKFQTIKAKNLASKQAPKAEYQNETTDSGQSQLEMLKKFEFNWEQHQALLQGCCEQGIMFSSTAFDLDSVALLEKLDLDFFKIPSGEITHLPYLRHIAQTQKPVIISTGMAELSEIEDCLKVFYAVAYSKDKITLLHCNTEYPTPYADVHLHAMETLRKEFGVAIGYSDHTLGIEVAVAAVALGATVIEKHFTLDRNLPGPDQKASLEPDELKAMVVAIRNIEQALGQVEKTCSPSERKNKDVARKSIVAAVPIPKGEIFTEQNLTCKRPGNGISPMRWDEVLGQRALCDFAEDETIEL